VALWLGGALLAPLLLLVGLFIWAGSDGSLARALQLAQRWLPEDQQLVNRNVRGSILGGGHIGQLVWSKPGATLTVDDLHIDWSLRQLIHRNLDIRTLSAQRVHWRSMPQPHESSTPFIMPAQLSLPIRLTVPLTVSRIEIEFVDEEDTASRKVLEDLSALYRYDGRQHTLRLANLRYGQSQVQGDVQLHATTLDLSAQLDASLRNLVASVPLAMQARLNTTGTLAGGDAAQLNVRLDAEQQNVVAANAAKIHAKALIHPWRQQPAQQLDLQFSHINTQAFITTAPVTALGGSASVQPTNADASLWNVLLDIGNDQPGAWDARRLPVRRLSTRARFSLQQVDIDTARIELAGRTASGNVTLSGKILPQQWQQSSLNLELQRIDLRALLTSLPRSAFTGRASLQPGSQQSQRIRMDLLNAAPGPLDQQRVPLDRVLADARITSAQWRIDTLDAQIGAGRVQLRGTYAPQTAALDLRTDVQQLPLQRIHGKLARDIAAQLSGTLAVAGKLQQRLAFDADIHSNIAATRATAQRGPWEIRALQASGNWSPTRLTLQRLHVDALQIIADGNDIDITLPQADYIQAQLTATAPGVKLLANAIATPQPSGKISLQLGSIDQTARWLQGLPFIGAQLTGLHARGGADLTADWQGSWRQWLAGTVAPRSQPQLRLNAHAQAADLHIEMPGAEPQPATRIDVQSFNLRTHATQVRGTGGAPRWDVTVENFALSAPLPDQTEPWQLLLPSPLQFTLQTGPDFDVRAGAGSARLIAPASMNAVEPLQLEWQPAVWRRSSNGAMTLQGTGAITGIQPAWLDTLLAKRGEGPLAAAGLGTDLLLRGTWDVRMTDGVYLRAQLQRERGDITLGDAETSAGIRALEVTVQADNENVNAALNWDTERAGVITARLGTRLERLADGWTLPPHAPLSGVIEAKMPSLRSWAFLAPPGWRIQGGIDANIDLAGTVHQPLLTGTLDGNDLGIRSVLDGVDLRGGMLRATLRESRMEIATLGFEGGTGSRAYVRGFSGNRTPPPTERGRMVASGSIDWSGAANASAAESGIAIDLRAKLERMQVLVRHDRQMTLSGDLSAGLQQGVLRVRGDLAVDRASIMLPEASAPTLGDDVVIVRNTNLRNPSAAENPQTRGELATRKPMDMQIKLDLGRDLALEGQGITSRLEGELTARSAGSGDNPVLVFGEVRTVEGRYRAWGQALNIETGVVRFNGPYINPALDLLAIRPNIEVRAGVRVTGTLLAPRVQLFSDPELPEGDKLSWVVLGRATVTGGAEGSSMQQAALSLAAGQLGGRLASGLGIELGLDEVGVSENGVSVGKRISNELYLTYQQSLAGAASTLYIFYDITRRLTVRAQASQASAVDLIYTIKYD
jgi:translocation and assembly module TamB